jgi:hypothetical protein
MGPVPKCVLGPEVSRAQVCPRLKEAQAQVGPWPKWAQAQVGTGPMKELLNLSAVALSEAFCHPS